jgi:hypothetical protein
VSLKAVPQILSGACVFAHQFIYFVRFNIPSSKNGGDVVVFLFGFADIQFVNFSLEGPATNRAVVNVPQITANFALGFQSVSHFAPGNRVSRKIVESHPVDLPFTGESWFRPRPGYQTIEVNDAIQSG